MYMNLLLYADTWLKKPKHLSSPYFYWAVHNLGYLSMLEQSTEIKFSVSLFQTSAMEANHFLILNQKLTWKR